MIIHYIIPDKILAVELQAIGSHLVRPEDKALSLGIQPPVQITYPPLRVLFAQIHPAGPPEGNLYHLPPQGPQGSGIGNYFPGFRGRRRTGGQIGNRVHRKGKGLPDRSGGGLGLRGPDKGRRNRGDRGSFPFRVRRGPGSGVPFGGSVAGSIFFSGRGFLRGKLNRERFRQDRRDLLLFRGSFGETGLPQFRGGLEKILPGLIKGRLFRGFYQGGKIRDLRILFRRGGSAGIG
jgi:hypothetical protein